MRIIGLAGTKGSGKTTIAKYLSDKYNYEEINFADPLKRALSQATEMDMHELKDEEFNEPFSLSRPQVDTLCRNLFVGGENKDKVQKLLTTRYFNTKRELMQYVGTDVFRNSIHSDFWIRLFFHEIRDAKKVVVPDVRFQNEKQLVHDFGGKVLYVDTKQSTEDTHESEQKITKDDCDVIINNNGNLSRALYDLDTWLNYIDD